MKRSRESSIASSVFTDISSTDTENDDDQDGTLINANDESLPSNLFVRSRQVQAPVGGTQTVAHFSSAGLTSAKDSGFGSGLPSAFVSANEKREEELAEVHVSGEGVGNKVGGDVQDGEELDEDFCPEESLSVFGQHLKSTIQTCADAFGPVRNGGSLSTIAPAPALVTSLTPFFQKFLRNASAQPRAKQIDIVGHILGDAGSLIGVLPTGWGKSLCFLLPIYLKKQLWLAYVRTLSSTKRAPPVGVLASRVRRQCIVVVSPLISLIQDQVAKLKSKLGSSSGSAEDLVPGMLGAGTSREVHDKIFNQMRSLNDPPPVHLFGDRLVEWYVARGDALPDVIFTSPERFVSSQELQCALVDSRENIAYVVLDEVHCVSQWGHDFRPSYLFVHKRLTELLGIDVRVIGLTATATPQALAEIKQLLNVSTVIQHREDRSNLTLAALRPPGDSPRGEDSGNCGRPLVSDPSARQRLVHAMVAEAVRTSEHPTLVYVTSQAQADELAASLHNELSSLSFAASPTVTITVKCFHAGLSASQRRALQGDFMANRVQVMVATVAFGMGVDKSDIRTVIHATCPCSVEAYVQETGRAGRDGKPSRCLVVFNELDYFAIRRRLLVNVLSFQQVKNIILGITGCPFIEKDGTAVISCNNLASDVGCSPEAVENILFALALAHPDVIASVGHSHCAAFRVSGMAKEDEGDRYVPVDDNCVRHGPRGMILAPSTALYGESSVQQPQGHHHHHHVQPTKKQRGAALSGVSGILAQLAHEDPVLELCRLAAPGKDINVIEAARSTRLSMEDLSERLKELAASGAMKLTWRQSGVVVRYGPAILNATTGVGASAAPNRGVTRGRPVATLASLDDSYTQLLAKEAYGKWCARIKGRLRGLQQLFAVLSAPNISAAVMSPDDSSVTPLWAPPAPQISKAMAVEIVHDFIKKSIEQIDYAEEAAKVLAGVSSVGGGGVPGEGIIAVGSWWATHHRFGALERFDFDWIASVARLQLQALRPSGEGR